MNELKRLAAKEALQFISPKLNKDTILGIGSGSTVNCFIELLGVIKDDFAGCVCASSYSEKELQKQGVKIFDISEVSQLEFYIDGADEINSKFEMIKGGGAALTREKVLNSITKKFICIVDESKKVPYLGKFPLPIEVVPFARSVVATKLLKYSNKIEYRQNCITDNGNIILDVHNLQITNATQLEQELNNIVGITTNGIFALKPADMLICAHKNGEIEILNNNQ